jgi:Zn-dependent metalloprotease
MKTSFPLLFDKRWRSLLVGLLVPCLVVVGLSITRITSAGGNSGVNSPSSNLSPLTDPNFPKEFDVRAIHGTPRETNLLDDPTATTPKPTLPQLRAVTRLQNVLGVLNTDKLQIRYSGLTATPRHIFNRDGYLSEPSNLPAEAIALNFVRQNRALFRFSEDDLNSLKLISRAVSNTGTTTLLYNQQIDGKTVYHGDVLVNVAKNGQILNVGGENYPNLSVSNSATISAAQAVQNAVSRLNISGFTPQLLGTKQVLATYGNLPPEFVTGEKFSRGSTFNDDIVVTQVIFPMGATGRLAYKFVLVTPQYLGIMWQHFVDAQTGETLRRNSLTSFQSLNPPGGGVGVGRKGTFRPDVQNLVESFNNAGTAQGKVFNPLPAPLSGQRGLGRSTRTGTNASNYVYTAPTYAPDNPASADPARGFQYGILNARNESPLPWDNNLVRPTFTHAQLPGFLGQIIRGFPDAANPSPASPFGWFYLPTETGGAEVTNGNTNRTTTKAAGYNIQTAAGGVGPIAKTRNAVNAANSPTGDGDQPFSADLTPVTSVNLPDGRILSSVFQSRYTEGNNVMVADDRRDDDETTKGVKGYSQNRQFTASYFDYVAAYEYGGANATSPAPLQPVDNFPSSTESDVFAGTVTLFYFNNIIHDYLYSVGFTEQFWNFQMDNFGKGGAGGDQVSAQVQDGSGVNNANFGTPDEGATPTMQMFLFGESSSSSFRRSDGDFDFDVVAHEFFHGVSNRSAGKGGSNCLGIALVGESGGMGEGWGDYIAGSMTDDDSAGEYVTGHNDIAIRRFPMTNFRYSYGSINDRLLSVRRTVDGTPAVPDNYPTGIAYEVHDIGEVWAATLWDMRELMIMKQKVGASFPGVFFDGNRRLGSGANFFIGERQLTSIDTQHPINYRNGIQNFNTSVLNLDPESHGASPTINPTEHIVRPGLIAAENASNPNRNGPLATAVTRGAQLADQLMLRGLQLTPCNPSFVEMRDAILAADREITGGENQAIIWRAFASHGVGQLARSTGGTDGTDENGGAQSAPTVVEDFSVPAGVTECETSGPLPAPNFTLSNSAPNAVTVTITALQGAANYVIGRSESPNGPFTTIATIPGSQTTYTDTDNGDNLTLRVGSTYYYQVRASRNAQCVGSASVEDVTISNGNPPNPAPIFAGVANVIDPRQNNKLIVNWLPATSLNPTSDIVYDVYRVTSITTASGQADSTTAPTFTPTAANRLTPAAGITDTSYTDTNLTLGQVYYYIVQARDTNNNKKDTFNTGNTAAKVSAPTSNTVTTTPFAIEDFQSANANNRFTPALTDEPTPNNITPVWQRVTGAQMQTATAAMFAPNIDTVPVQGGGNSDFSAIVGPLTLSPTSVLEFDSRFVTEFAFDGGVMEVALGAAPTFNSQVFPDNTTTYDLNYFIIENGYLGKLDGTLAGPVILSPLQGRYAFTGTRATKRVRVALGNFAPGGQLNSGSQQVYLRFRMTSDVGTSPGEGSGWYIDNLVVNNYNPSLDIGGVVSYGTDSQKLVPGVSVAATPGSPSITATTNAAGAYLLTGLSAGEDYTVTPTKTGDSNGISPFDATMILRHVASNGTGPNALNANQQKAADTNGDGNISPFDATVILRYVAAGGPNANTGQVGTWKFDPVSRPYQDLNSSFLNENYTAFLLGDLNGSWAPSSPPPTQAEESARLEQLKSRAEENDGETIAAARPVKTDIQAETDGASLQVSLPTDITAGSGDTVEIPIMLANDRKTRISTYTIDVEFDPSVLRPDFANPVDTNGTLSENGFTVSADTKSAKNRIGIAAASGAGLIEGSGTIIKLRFKVGSAKGASNSTALTRTRLSFQDADGKRIAAAASDGLFTMTPRATLTKRS